MNAYRPPENIIFGVGCIERLPALVERQDMRSAALFAGGSALKNERVQRVLAECGDRIKLCFDKIKSDPDVETIDRALADARGEYIDGIVAIGGGSVIVFAKAFGAGYSNGCTIETLYTYTDGYPKRLPLIALPTTSGTGSEVTRAAALTFNGVKKPVFDNALIPYAAIIDPELTLSCPPHITAACGMDALAHALESLMHRNSGEINEKKALYAAEKVFSSIENCYISPYNIKMRTSLSDAAMNAGLAIAYSGCTVSHACSYALTIEYGLAHGEACAFTLDGLIRLCAAHDGKMDGYARMLGFGSAEAMADKVLELKKNLGLRYTLGQLGLGEEAAVRLTDAAMSSAVVQNHYFTVEREDVLSIFRACI